MTYTTKNSIFDNCNIGPLKLKNRLVRSATWENMATSTGHLTQSLYDIHEELAKNEVGLIVTGYANVVAEEQPNPGMIGIYEDSFIDEYKKLTDIVKSHGSKIVMQLAYGGTKTKFNVGERVIFAPSEVAEKSTGTMGKEMTLEDIDYIVNAFANAAKRAEAAGFDGVEIHGAHTYLINQFLSPYYNRRKDNYGGSLENRMRFLVDIIAKTKESVSDDFAILVKLTASDFFDGGLEFEETLEICKRIEKLGIAGIELSGNVHGKAKTLVGEVFDGCPILDEGYFLEYAKILKSSVSIPVITVGGFRNFDKLEQIAGETSIDAFGFCRPLLAEPNLFKRWKDGDHSPAKCVRCSKCRTPEGNYCVVFNSL
ncbi:MAG: NADH:flavin oxidoreductase [Tissierellales bacterium]|jgi:2,4-dienoyl-CoA reductase-like NADH-dependent reductase (Old Yellow Enzyme family)|nr:NADH:flavin oxidoreductase [Tissierellales bacterium]